MFGVRKKARELAFFSLYIYDLNSMKLSEIMDLDWYCVTINYFKTQEGLPIIYYDKKEKIFNLALDIIKGCIDHLTEIDEVIKKYLVKWTFDRLNLLDKAILRISIYSFFYQKNIPPEVVISEANRIADKYCEENTPEYLNGILNKIYHDILK